MTWARLDSTCHWAKKTWVYFRNFIFDLWLGLPWLVSNPGNTSGIQLYPWSWYQNSLLLISQLFIDSDLTIVDAGSKYTLWYSSWLSIAVVGSIACACGDTWASEIGSVMGNGYSTLVTTRKKVPAGTKLHYLRGLPVCDKSFKYIYMLIFRN